MTTNCFACDHAIAPAEATDVHCACSFKRWHKSCASNLVGSCTDCGLLYSNVASTRLSDDLVRSLVGNITLLVVILTLFVPPCPGRTCRTWNTGSRIVSAFLICLLVFFCLFAPMRRICQYRIYVKQWGGRIYALMWFADAVLWSILIGVSVHVTTHTCRDNGLCM